MGQILDVRAFMEAFRPEMERRIDAAGIAAECHLHLTVDGRPHSVILCRSHHITHAAASVMAATVKCSRQALLQLSLGTLPLECIPDVEISGARPLTAALFPCASPFIYAPDRF
jgi:hypothetical protein